MGIPTGARRLTRLGSKSCMCLAKAVCATESTTRGEVCRALLSKGRLPMSMGKRFVCCLKPAPTERKRIVKSTKPAADDEVSGCAPAVLSRKLGNVVKGKGQSSRIVRSVGRGNTMCFTTIKKTKTLLSGYVGRTRMVTCSSLKARTVQGLEIRGFPIVMMVSGRKGGLCRATMRGFGGLGWSVGAC